MKIERLISMIYKLLNHEVLSASTLAEEFQVSARTIYRDMDVLSAAGFPVVSHQGTNGGYGLIDGYKMDKSLLGSYDVHSLITILTSLSSVLDDTRMQGTIERLQTIGPEYHTQSLTVDLKARQIEPDALPLLRTGITTHQVIQFEYINMNNERSTRQIEPIRLDFKYRNWYVYGFCQTRQDYREFRLSRMMNVCITSENFHPHHVPLQSASKPYNTPQSDTTEVVIQVYPEALAKAMDQFQQADMQFHVDGSMTARFKIHQPLKAPWLWSFLLSLGSGAEVLEPLELRDIVKQQFHDALTLYESR